MKTKQEKQEGRSAESKIAAAIVNLAVDMKVPEIRRAIAALDRLNNPAGKPVLEVLQSRLREVESLRFPDHEPFDHMKDRDEYERRERLLDLKK